MDQIYRISIDYGRHDSVISHNMLSDEIFIKILEPANPHEHWVCK